jgi:hypothetical protein
MKRTKFLPVWALIFALTIYGCSKVTADDPTPTFTIEGDTYKILETKSGLPICVVYKQGEDRVLSSYQSIVGVVTKKFMNTTRKDYYIKLSYIKQSKGVFGEQVLSGEDWGLEPCNLPSEFQVEGAIVKIDGNVMDPILDYFNFRPFPTIIANISKLSK